MSAEVRQCLCGCGGALAYLDKRGRKRKYIHGHNGRKLEKKKLTPEENVARVKSWRKANPGVFKAQLKRAWTRRYWNNRERELERSKARQRVSRSGCRGKHTLEQWMSRVEYYGWRCRYCGLLLSKLTLTMDHVKPLSKGGTDWASNLVPACRSCNSRKGAKCQM